MPDPDAAGPRYKPVQNFEPSRRHVGTGPDTDKDGLSDDFETNVFLSDPNKADKDGDGLNDWAEYWVDTNPNKADTDGDGYMDGEDLAFGDPLAHDADGAERAKFVENARKQFAAEGSDQDKDLVRDYLEVQSGTQKDNPDSDNDGLGDMVDLQLKTSPTSAEDDTSDLDTARARLGERRFAAQNQQSSNNDDGATSDDTLAGESYTDADAYATYEQSAVEIDSYAEPAYEAPSYSEPVAEETYAEASTDDTGGDAWA